MNNEISQRIDDLDFSQLVHSIQVIHEQLFTQAIQSVNISLTLRNWLIGLYIVEYELNGSDKATYGDRLFEELGHKMKEMRIPNCNRRQLYRYRDFYQTYPEIVGTVSPQLISLLPVIHGQKEKVGTASPQSTFAPDELLRSLSYSHFEILVSLDDPNKRQFYEYESIRGSWSVRELKRQVASLYYERTGLSINKKKLTNMVHTNSEPLTAAQIIRDPYIFEFIGIRPQDIMSESLLEDHLITKIQNFLLELGRGFCFEARQKRILIGEEHFFVDLVFYHRILKCHILIELKVDEFTHEHIGQLNTYVNWYKKNEISDGDNPPIGILLCTKKNQTLVEYALAGMDNQIFVSKYLIELPNKEEIKKFIEDQINEE